jgi:hypothetical protein
MRSGDLWHGFGKDLSSAGWIAASETPHFQSQFHSTSLPRQVLETPFIPTVARPRCMTAGWTTNPLLDVRAQQKTIIHAFDLVQDQVLSGQNGL